MISIPIFCIWAATTLDVSRSMLGMMLSSISTIVTLVPSSAKRHANSQPMTPPPRISRDFGISGIESSSVEVMTLFPFGINPGTSVSEPLAMMILFAVISSTSPPSPSTTLTVFLPVNAPCPLNTVTPAALSREPIPPRRVLITESLRASMASQSGETSPEILTPNSIAWRAL